MPEMDIGAIGRDEADGVSDDQPTSDRISLPPEIF